MVHRNAILTKLYQYTISSFHLMRGDTQTPPKTILCFAGAQTSNVAQNSTEHFDR